MSSRMHDPTAALQAQHSLSRTLFLTDLDGTLLGPDQRTSGRTNELINRMVQEGMRFSYATARSWYSAHRVTAGMEARFPIIVYNGAMVLDSQTREILLSNYFSQEESDEILRSLLQAGASPVVYAMPGGKESFIYNLHPMNAPTRDFVRSRPNDPRDTPVESDESLFAQNTFYFTCIDTPERLAPLNEKYKDRYHCVYGADIYSGEQWLEIMPLAASKANAARQLMKLMDCEHLVAFGDGLNDTDMFALADEAYAVENAHPDLKALATAVIGPHSEDSVALWLKDRWSRMQPT